MDLGGWQEVSLDDGSGKTYWYHKETRQSRWEKPDNAMIRKLEMRLKVEREATAKRRAQRIDDMRKAEQRDAEQAAVTESAAIDAQRRVNEWLRGKRVQLMIRTLHELLPRSLLAEPIKCGETSADVKRAYREAVKVVHPDKLSTTTSTEDKQLCSKAFMAITEAFNEFRSQ